MPPSVATPNSAFCILPWISVCATLDGRYGRCCVDQTIFEHGDAFVKATRPEMRLSDDSLGCAPLSPFANDNVGKVCSLRDAFNGAQLRATRLAMIAGNQLSACSGCYEQEKFGTTSVREIWLSRLADRPDWQFRVDSTREDGSIESEPLELDLRLGNMCSLRCKMCGYPTSFGHLHNAGDAWLRAPLDPYSLDTEFWSGLRDMVPKVERIHFAGGEPLLQPAHEKVLELCIRLGCADSIELSYNSSLSVLPERILPIWRKYKKVSIGASCDGTEDVFEKIRKPLKWETFVNNIQKARTVSEVYLVPTIQRDNIERIDELVEWAMANSFAIELHGILTWPLELRIQALEATRLKNARLKCEQLAERLRARGEAKMVHSLSRLCATLLNAEANSLRPTQEDAKS